MTGKSIIKTIPPRLYVHTPFLFQSSSTANPLNLLALLMDWTQDGQMFTSVAGNERKGIAQCLPPDVCLKVTCYNYMNPVLVYFIFLLQPNLYMHSFFVFVFLPGSAVIGRAASSHSLVTNTPSLPSSLHPLNLEALGQQYIGKVLMIAPGGILDFNSNLI